MPRKRKVMMPRGAIQQKAEWSGSRGSYLTAIPNLAKDTMEEMEVFSIREPFTYARILYDHDRSEYIYEVWEPHLDAREKEFLDMIKDSLNRTLEYEWDKMAEKDKKEYIYEAVDSFIKSRGLRREPDPGRDLLRRRSCPGDVQPGGDDPRVVLHDPALQGEALHPRRTGEVRDRERGDGRLPLGRRRERQVHDGLRRHRLGEDGHPEQRRLVYPPWREDRLDRGHARDQPPARELDPWRYPLRSGRARGGRESGRRNRHV